MTKLTNFEIDIDLRKKFKIASYMNGKTMKDCVIIEIDRIIKENENLWRCPRPDEERRVNFTILLDKSYKHKMRDYAHNKDRYTRDLMITAIINIVQNFDNNFEIPDGVIDES